MVFITIVTGANLKQLLTGGPHIVDTINIHQPRRHVAEFRCRCLHMRSNMCVYFFGTSGILTLNLQPLYQQYSETSLHIHLYKYLPMHVHTIIYMYYQLL
jgi:hypothetical protein